MECNKRSRNIRYAIFRYLNLNRISNVLLNRTKSFSRTFVMDLVNEKFFFAFGSIMFLHLCQIVQNEMSHFFENRSKLF